MPSDREEDSLENDKPRGSGLSEIMKKALFASIGAVFMTEESIRSYVSEAKLPREIRGYLLQNTQQAKEQFFRYLAGEISQIVIRSDLPRVFERFLTDHTIEIEAKIRFKSNGQAEVSAEAKAMPVPAAPSRAAPAAGNPPPAREVPPPSQAAQPAPAGQYDRPAPPSAG